MKGNSIVPAIHQSAVILNESDPDFREKPVVRRNVKRFVAIWLAIAFYSAAALGTKAQSYSIARFTIAGGGGTSTGGLYSISGALGQPDAGGPLTGGSYSLAGGFWSLLSTVQVPGAPRLAIRMTGPGTAMISWPSPSTGFSLQQNYTPDLPGWTPAPEPVTDDGIDRFITVTPPAGNRFYRLAATSTLLTLLAQDFNAGDGGFTVETPIAYDGPWVYNAGSGSWGQAGQALENGHPNTSLLTSPPINVTQAGSVRLSFAHRHSLEADSWDGGQVRVSINGGAFTAVPGSAFTQNGYNGTVRASSQSELHGQSAFVENSVNFAAGPITSICNLGSFQAGDSIRVQFIAASDPNTRGAFQPGWEIDSLQIAL